MRSWAARTPDRRRPGGSRIPRGASSRGARDRRPVSAHRGQTRGECDELRDPEVGQARRSVRHDQRSAGVEGARPLDADFAESRPLRPSGTPAASPLSPGRTRSFPGSPRRRVALAPVLDLDLRRAPSLVFDLSVGSTAPGRRPEGHGNRRPHGNAFPPDAGGRAHRWASAATMRRGSSMSRLSSSRAGPHRRASDRSSRRRSLRRAGIARAGAAPGRRPHSRQQRRAAGLRSAGRPETPDGRGPSVLHPLRPPQPRHPRRPRRGAIRGSGAGDRARGLAPTNGDWAPHVHFQIILDLLDLGRDFPGVCRASERELVEGPLARPQSDSRHSRGAASANRRPRAATTLAKRRRLLGGNVSLSYQRPLKIVRGFGAYLYDETGRAFLDMYNNVPLVGHTPSPRGAGGPGLNSGS